MSDLKIEISADLGNTLSATEQLKAKLNQTKETVELLKSELKGLNQSLTANDKAFATVNKQLKGLNTNTKEGAKEAAGLKAQLVSLAGVNNTLTKGIVSTKLELANETAALKSHTKEVLAAEKGGSMFAKGLSKVWGGLRTIANIVPGLGIGGLIGILAGPLVDGIAKLVESFNKGNKALKSFNEALDGGKEGFVKATLEVSNMRIAFDQARNGIIKKEEALKLYNETIGKTTGEVKSLDEAEKALNRNAEAYIKFSLLKASANFALEESAKKAFEAEKTRIRQASEFQTIGSNASVGTAGQSMAPGFVPGQGDLDKQFLARQQAAEKNKQKQVKIAQDESNDLLNISKKFFKDAEKLAAEFNFDFNAIKEPTPEAAKKIKKKIEKAFVPESLLLRPSLIDISPEKVLLDKAEAEKKLRESLGNVKMKVRAEIEFDIQNSNKPPTASFIPNSSQLAVQLKNDLITYEDFKNAIIQMNQDMADSLHGTLDAAFASIGESIGESIATGADFGKTLFGNLFQVLGAGLKQLGEAMIGLGTAKMALEKFKFAPGIATVVAGIAVVALGSILQNAIPGFANGVNNFGGGLAMVGERGPELVRLPKGSDVIPNGRMSGVSGTGMAISVEGRIVGNGSDLVMIIDRARQRNSRNN